MLPEFQEEFETFLTRVRDSDPELTDVDLSEEELNDEDVIRLVEALQNNTTITKLDLEGNNIGNAGAIALANTKLVNLQLGYNQIEDAGIVALAANKTIKSLDVTCSHIGIAGATALANNTSLEILTLDASTVGNEGAIALAQTTSIKNLSLHECGISDEGAQGLAANGTIEILELEENNIGPQGARALAANEKLIKLNMTVNPIGNDGAEAFALNTKLRSLDIVDCQIGDKGAKAFLDNNDTLWHLEAENNEVSDEMSGDFKNLVIRNRNGVSTGSTLYLQFKGEANRTLSHDQLRFLSDSNHPENALKALKFLHFLIEITHPNMSITQYENLFPREIALASGERIKSDEITLESGEKIRNVYTGIDKALILASKAPEKQINRLPGELSSIVKKVELSSHLYSSGVHTREALATTDLQSTLSLLDVRNVIGKFLDPNDIVSRNETETKAMARKLTTMQLPEEMPLDIQGDMQGQIKGNKALKKHLSTVLSKEELSILTNDNRQDLLRGYVKELIPSSTVITPEISNEVAEETKGRE